MPLLEARKQYKPFEYPWAFEFWKRQQQIHWMPEEVPLGEDCRDWAQKLTEHERNLLTQIFRFFTQADVEVQDCYHDKYGRVFKPTEIKMMLTAFSNMETVHIAAYSHLLDTIGMPESEYGMFLQYKEMKDKHDYLATFGVDTRRGHRPHARHVRRLHRGAAALRQLRDADELPALQQDEGHGPDRQLERARREPPLRGHHPPVPRLRQGARLHDQGGPRRHHATSARRRSRLEDAFIDLAFEMGPVPGMTPKEIKKYIRYIADWRLGQLGFQPIYMIDDHPLPWLAPLLNGVEHANFFETRATEYSKAATRGNWGEVWDNFDRRKTAKAANDGAGGAAKAGTTCSRGRGWRRSENPSPCRGEGQPRSGRVRACPSSSAGTAIAFTSTRTRATRASRSTSTSPRAMPTPSSGFIPK